MAALRRLSRWGALAPQIGAKINETLRRRVTGSRALPGPLTARRSLAASISTSLSSSRSTGVDDIAQEADEADAPAKSRRRVVYQLPFALD